MEEEEEDSCNNWATVKNGWLRHRRSPNIQTTGRRQRVSKGFKKSQSKLKMISYLFQVRSDIARPLYTLGQLPPPYKMIQIIPC